MRSTYLPFVNRMITRYEGGYCWDKNDPGGPTKYGITCYDLAEHRGQKMHSMSAWAPIVKAMTRDEADEIYRKKYARRIRYDDLPAGIDVEFMDYGVNSGWARPIRVTRKLLGLPGGDVLDDKLLAAINAADTNNLIDRISRERLQFMHQIRGGRAWAEFGHGWQSRVDDLSVYAKHLVASPTPSMAHETAPEAVDLSNVPTPKATHADPQIVPKVAGRLTSLTAVVTYLSQVTGLSETTVMVIGGVLAAAIVGAAVWGVYKAAHNDRIVGQVTAFLQGWRTKLSAGVLGGFSMVLLMQDKLAEMGIDLSSLLTDRLPTEWVGVGGLVIAGWFFFMRNATEREAIRAEA